MNSFINRKKLWLSIVFVMCFALVSTESFAQKRPPLMQDIRVRSGNATPSPTPLIKKTGNSKPVYEAPVNRNPYRSPIAALANADIPGYSGVLVETLDGRVIVQNYSNSTFNPASNVKVATTYAVLKTFGPNYRFKTTVWTDGTIDRLNRTLMGNLYVAGRDPIFSYEHAVSIANELNQMGISKIEGDLIVTSNFAMNFNRSSQRSGNLLFATMNGARRSSAAKRAWSTYVLNAGRYGRVNETPSVYITGGLYVEPLASAARLLFTHESAPMKEILKATMIFSNNFLSERLGEMLGGAYGVARIVQREARLMPQEFSLQTCSGLGINRVSPRAQMKLLRTLRRELQKYRLNFTDVMPVAGIDKGTLSKRFNTTYSRGSVVGKTGTLPRTDRGVSTLSGEVKTRRGTLLFVIFNQRGGVLRFRGFQNSYVSLIQNVHGGAARIPYVPIPIERRLAKSRIVKSYNSRYRTEE